MSVNMYRVLKLTVLILSIESGIDTIHEFYTLNLQSRNKANNVIHKICSLKSDKYVLDISVPFMGVICNV